MTRVYPQDWHIHISMTSAAVSLRGVTPDTELRHRLLTYATWGSQLRQSARLMSIVVRICANLA